MAHEGRKQLVHRVAFQLFIGPIPEGMQVDHLCGVRHCVNPAHLETVTPLVNTRRAERGNARKTHCDAGHEFTPENTRYRTDRPGRLCRSCDAERARQYRERDPQRTKEKQMLWYARNNAVINAKRRKARAA